MSYPMLKNEWCPTNRGGTRLLYRATPSIRKRNMLLNDADYSDEILSDFIGEDYSDFKELAANWGGYSKSYIRTLIHSHFYDV